MKSINLLKNFFVNVFKAKFLYIFLIVGLIILFSCHEDKQKKVHKLLLSAKQKIYLLNFESAIEDLNKCLKIDKNNAEAFFLLGNIYTTQQKYQQAIENYNKAIELNKNFIEAYINRGKVWHILGDNKKRCEDYLKAESLGAVNIEHITKFCKEYRVQTYDN